MSISFYTVHGIADCVVVTTASEAQQSSTHSSKANVTRRCFHWVRDINLRVRFHYFHL